MKTHNPLGFHQVQAALYDVLVELHANVCQDRRYDDLIMIDSLWYTVHEKTTHAIIAVIYRDEMSCFVKLIGAC